MIREEKGLPLGQCLQIAQVLEKRLDASHAGTSQFLSQQHMTFDYSLGQDGTPGK